MSAHMIASFLSIFATVFLRNVCPNVYYRNMLTVLNTLYKMFKAKRNENTGLGSASHSKARNKCIKWLEHRYNCFVNGIFLLMVHPLIMTFEEVFY